MGMLPHRCDLYSLVLRSCGVSVRSRPLADKPSLGRPPQGGPSFLNPRYEDRYGRGTIDNRRPVRRLLKHCNKEKIRVVSKKNPDLLQAYRRQTRLSER
jgi:hypothetical protein